MIIELLDVNAVAYVNIDYVVSAAARDGSLHALENGLIFWRFGIRETHVMRIEARELAFLSCCLVEERKELLIALEACIISSDLIIQKYRADPKAR